MSLSDYQWNNPPDILRVSEQDVHVWRASLDLSDTQRDSLYAVLSEDEIHRAKRFIFPRDHNRFVAARGILRHILSYYVGAEPQMLQFSYGNHGKPMLAATTGLHSLRFNLAHSHMMALYAVAYEREVGIDLEHVRPEVEYEHIARRFFVPREYDRLRVLPSSEQQRAFFTSWTLKEAYIKGRGVGMWQALNQFEVSFPSGEHMVLTVRDSYQPDGARWSLRELFPADDYTAAIAVEGHDWHIQCWHWNQA
jgi:4'-phosphopantetheinyl transferase